MNFYNKNQNSLNFGHRKEYPLRKDDCVFKPTPLNTCALAVLIKLSPRRIVFVQRKPWWDNVKQRSFKVLKNIKKNQLIQGLQTAALSLALSFFITAPAMAEAPPVPLSENNTESGVSAKTTLSGSAYTLNEIPDADPQNLPDGAITLYEKTAVTKYFDPTTGQEVAAGDRQPDVEYKEVTTYETTPKYYTLSLNKTEYGDKNAPGAIPIYYKWTTDGTGNKQLTQGSADDYNIVYYGPDTSSATVPDLSGMQLEYGDKDAPYATPIFF